ncbi:hypothetical protein OQA88_5528 [Cercophora sp. LCS_1]
MIERDDEGLAFFLDHYRPFRLKMLRECPSAFSSTIAREEAFDLDTWKQRFFKPIAWTFVAVKNTDGRRAVISSLTILGPLDTDETDRPSAISDNKRDDGNAMEPALVERWAITAVFTDPEFRRLGIGSQVLAAATRHAVKESGAKRSDCLLTLGLMPDNMDARAFYEKAGFRFWRPDASGGEVDLAKYITASKGP